MNSKLPLGGQGRPPLQIASDHSKSLSAFRQRGFCVETKVLCALLFQLPVAEVEADVNGNHGDIENVKIEREIVIVLDELCGNAAEIAEQDKKAEEDALALRRAAAVGTDDGKRPRNAKADDHHGL